MSVCPKPPVVSPPTLFVGSIRITSFPNLEDSIAAAIPEDVPPYIIISAL